MYKHLDNEDLKKEYENLLTGMATFTKESKRKYHEAWSHRQKLKKEIEAEFESRGKKIID